MNNSLLLFQSNLIRTRAPLLKPKQAYLLLAISIFAEFATFLSTFFVFLPRWKGRSIRERERERSVIRSSKYHLILSASDGCIKKPPFQSKGLVSAHLTANILHQKCALVVICKFYVNMKPQKWSHNINKQLQEHLLRIACQQNDASYVKLIVFGAFRTLPSFSALTVIRIQT